MNCQSCILLLALKYVSWICKVELCDMVSPAVSGFCHKCCQSHKSLFGTALTLYFIVLYYFLLLLLVYYSFPATRDFQFQTGVQFHYVQFCNQHSALFCNNIKKYKVWREGNCYDIVNTFMDTFWLYHTIFCLVSLVCIWKLWNDPNVSEYVKCIQTYLKNVKCIQIYLKMWNVSKCIWKMWNVFNCIHKL